MIRADDCLQISKASRPTPGFTHHASGPRRRFEPIMMWFDRMQGKVRSSDGAIRPPPPRFPPALPPQIKMAMVRMVSMSHMIEDRLEGKRMSRRTDDVKTCRRYARSGRRDCKKPKSMVRWSPLINAEGLYRDRFMYQSIETASAFGIQSRAE